MLQDSSNLLMREKIDQVVAELARYRVDVAGLQEMKCVVCIGFTALLGGRGWCGELER